MEFREPDAKIKNAIRLLPAALLLLAVVFTGHQSYRYFAGLDDDPLWVVVGAVALIYFSFRTVHAMRTVLVWEHAEDED